MNHCFGHPLFCCGFRPFFLLTASFAVVAMVLWVGILSGWPFMPAQQGGPFLWHMHEMVFGFGVASVAGFLLTAVVEFTGSKPMQYRSLALLAGLWLVARIGFLFSGVLGIWLGAVAQLLMMAWLAWVVIPPLWRDQTRRHISFALTLLLLFLLEVAFVIELAQGGNAARWVYAATSLMMILIIIALSRISMRIVNEELEAAGELETEYRARPPLRNLAIFMIGLFAVMEFAMPGNAITGWVALAAAAAIFNLLNDWHVGRALFRRRALMLYGIYLLMAPGFALIGLSLLGSGFSSSAGRHLLLAGSMGLAILMVMLIAGRAHSGYGWALPRWAIVAVGLLVVSAILRTVVGMNMGFAGMQLLLLSALAWGGAFLLYLLASWHMLIGPRPDGGEGCEETLIAQDASLRHEAQKCTF